ncbi:uncharacterized protein JN550_007189 [Neoarthrinium moseri]|uniref:uncharacterized protein n=1 Tax=Neoarthrinium moseri TaxID=1658444 RepID=UPI001FDD2A9E|nr:uncharacterized protein JN550_007189 [Neoarthrinium moseri]KAI1867137.1 hypothetical protein JN550_007189 [Neoarthrinium moseri]
MGSEAFRLPESDEKLGEISESVLRVIDPVTERLDPVVIGSVVKASDMLIILSEVSGNVLGEPGDSEEVGSKDNDPVEVASVPSSLSVAVLDTKLVESSDVELVIKSVTLLLLPPIDSEVDTEMAFGSEVDGFIFELSFDELSDGEFVETAADEAMPEVDSFVSELSFDELGDGEFVEIAVDEAVPKVDGPAEMNRDEDKMPDTVSPGDVVSRSDPCDASRE